MVAWAIRALFIFAWAMTQQPAVGYHLAADQMSGNIGKTPEVPEAPEILTEQHQPLVPRDSTSIAARVHKVIKPALFLQAPALAYAFFLPLATAGLPPAAGASLLASGMASIGVPYLLRRSGGEMEDTGQSREGRETEGQAESMTDQDQAEQTATAVPTLRQEAAIHLDQSRAEAGALRGELGRAREEGGEGRRTLKQLVELKTGRRQKEIDAEQNATAMETLLQEATAAREASASEAEGLRRELDRARDEADEGRRALEQVAELKTDRLREKVEAEQNATAMETLLQEAVIDLEGSNVEKEGLRRELDRALEDIGERRRALDQVAELKTAHAVLERQYDRLREQEQLWQEHLGRERAEAAAVGAELAAARRTISDLSKGAAELPGGQDPARGRSDQGSQRFQTDTAGEMAGQRAQDGAVPTRFPGAGVTDLAPLLSSVFYGLRAGGTIVCTIALVWHYVARRGDPGSFGARDQRRGAVVPGSSVPSSPPAPAGPAPAALSAPSGDPAVPPATTLPVEVLLSENQAELAATKGARSLSPQPAAVGAAVPSSLPALPVSPPSPAALHAGVDEKSTGDAAEKAADQTAAGIILSQSSQSSLQVPPAREAIESSPLALSPSPSPSPSLPPSGMAVPRPTTTSATRVSPGRVAPSLAARATRSAPAAAAPAAAAAAAPAAAAPAAAATLPCAPARPQKDLAPVDTSSSASQAKLAGDVDDGLPSLQPTAPLASDVASFPAAPSSNVAHPAAYQETGIGILEETTADSSTCRLAFSPSSVPSLPALSRGGPGDVTPLRPPSPAAALAAALSSSPGIDTAASLPIPPRGRPSASDGAERPSSPTGGAARKAAIMEEEVAAKDQEEQKKTARRLAKKRQKKRRSAAKAEDADPDNLFAIWKRQRAAAAALASSVSNGAAKGVGAGTTTATSRRKPSGTTSGTACGAEAERAAAKDGPTPAMGAARGEAAAERAAGGAARGAESDKKESRRERRQCLKKEQQQQQDELEQQRQLPGAPGRKGKVPQAVGMAKFGAWLEDDSNDNSDDPELFFQEVEEFLGMKEAGIGEIISLGAKFGVCIRGDGNCFWSASTIGALLAALCEEDTEMLMRIVRRFRGAVFRDTSRIAWRGLPQQVKEEVQEFMLYLGSILDAKERSEHPSQNRALAVDLVLDFSKSAVNPEDSDAPRFSRLYRGMVVASRMVAVCGTSNDADASVLTVGAFRHDFPDNLRPGAHLGVYMSLIHESFRDKKDQDQVHVVDYGDEHTRTEAGMGTVPPDLLPAHGVALRLGIVHHFDLRVNVDCMVGGILKEIFEEPIVSEEEGRAESLRLLQAEQSSRDGSKAKKGGCPACTSDIKRKCKKCPCCNTPLPDGFVFADGVDLS